MRFLRLVFRNLLRNKRRSILTVVAIAVSFFLFSCLASLPAAVNKILTASAASLRLVSHGKAGEAYLLPLAYEQKIAATPHVAAVAAWQYFGGSYRDTRTQFS